MNDILQNVSVSSDILSTLNDFLTIVKHLMALFGSLVILTVSLFIVC